MEVLKRDEVFVSEKNQFDTNKIVIGRNFATSIFVPKKSNRNEYGRREWEAVWQSMVGKVRRTASKHKTKRRGRIAAPGGEEIIAQMF